MKDNPYFEQFKEKINKLAGDKYVCVIDSSFNEDNKQFFFIKACDKKKRRRAMRSKEYLGKSEITKDVVAGLSYFPEHFEGEAYVANVYVSEDLRKKGLATLLMRAALHDLKEQGLKYVYLITSLYNHEMVKRAENFRFENNKNNNAIWELENLQELDL